MFRRHRVENVSRDAVKREVQNLFGLEARSSRLETPSSKLEPYLLSATEGPGVAPKSPPRRLFTAVRAARATGWVAAAAP